MAQNPWDFTDETSSRVQGDPAARQYQLLPQMWHVDTTVSPPVVDQDDYSDTDVIVADFDDDGDDDILVTRKKFEYSPTEGKPDFLLMNENGVLTDRTLDFAPDLLADLPSRDVAVFDYDQDGYMDAVIGVTGGNDPILLRNLGKQNGQWLGLDKVDDWFTIAGCNPATMPDCHTFSPGLGTCSVKTGDLNGDGWDDIYLGNYYDNSTQPAFSGTDRVLLNDQNGHFNEDTTLVTDSVFINSFTIGVEIVDMNGDCRDDIVRTSAAIFTTAPVMVAYQQDPGMPFTYDEVVVPGTTYFAGVADLNNDNFPDLYVGNDNEDYYHYNWGPSGGAGPCVGASNGPSVFSAGNQAPAGADGFAGNILNVDLDEDGRKDVILADVDPSQGNICVTGGSSFGLMTMRNVYSVPWFPGLEDPFAGQTLPWLNGGILDMAVLELNPNDTKLDLVTFGCDGIKVYIQN